MANEGSKAHQENLKKTIELTKEAAKAEGGGQPSQINDEKLKQARTKLEGDLVKIKQESEKAQEKIETDAAAFARMREQEMVTAAQEASSKINELRINGLQKGLITEQQFAAAVLNIQKKLNSDITQIRTKSNNDEIQALKNLEAQNQKTATGFSAAWQKNAAQARQDLGSMAKAGEITFNSFKTRSVEAFKAMGDGSKSGADAVKGFMLGSLGDIAMEYGTFHLINGAATYNFVEVAEGGALIALGAALQSMGSSSGSSSSSASSGGGGGGAGPAGISDPGSPATPAPQAAQTKSLTVAISGNIFETDQTRTRMMDMIRQAGDFTDFNLKQIGQS